MNSQTIFTYNNISIGYPIKSGGAALDSGGTKISEYSIKNIMNEAGTSPLYQEISLTIEGLVTGGDNTVSNISAALMTPRKALNFAIAGQNISEINIPAGGDVRFGPIPESISTTEIFGGAPLIFVKFKIKFWLSLWCDNTGILSQTYSVKTSMNENFIATRTITGKLVIAANNGQPIPDSFRDTIWFAVPDMWYRESCEFDSSTDGLSLDFTITDKQWEKFPIPYPCTTIDASYSVSMENYAWHSNFSATANGTTISDPLQMYLLLFLLAQSRIDFTNEIITGGTITEQLFKNQISISFTTQIFDFVQVANSGVYPKSNKIFTGLLPAWNTFNNTKPKTSFSSTLGPYATSNIKNLVAVWVDCSSDNTPTVNINYPGAQANNMKPAGSQSTTVTVSENTSKPTTSANNSNNAPSGPYILYRDYYQVITHSNIVMLEYCDPTVPPDFVQSSQPYQIITHYGHAARSKQLPVFPPPCLDGGNTTNTYIVSQELMNHTPELLQDKKTVSYGVSWNYIIYRALPKSDLSADPVYTNMQSPTMTSIPMPQNPLITTQPILSTPLPVKDNISDSVKVTANSTPAK